MRDPESSRRAILEAASEAFAERGYRDATLRDIAGRAGVTHGLVLRHFGSKEALFLAAVPGTRDVTEVASGPAGELAQRIAAGYVLRMEAPRSDEPFLALVRSASVDDGAAARLHVAMQERSEAAYVEALGDVAARALVPLLASLLIGVTFSRYVVRAGALADMTSAEFEVHLGAAIGGLLSTVVPPAAPARRPAAPATAPTV